MLKEMVLAIIIIAAIWIIYTLLPSKFKKMNYMNRKKNNEKVIYLTFDDGPDSKYTEELLNLLKLYDVKATFFTVVSSAVENKDIINRMQLEGHAIGFHSFKHKSAMIEGPIKTKNEIESAVKGMKSLGVETKLFRSPWGHTNLMQLYLFRKKGIKQVFWDVMAEDWEGNTSVDVIKMKLLHRVNCGDVICLHDARGENEAPKRTIKALKSMIPYWLDNGYKFKIMN